MTFLHPLLLLAGLGVALPILAHLLNRFQVRRTDWAAMRFLDRSVRVRSRQLRLRDLLLLLVRCAALLLLTLALARPAWTGLPWLPGEPRAGAVIALDTSFSMAHREGDSTRFRKALDLLDVIISRLRPGDPVSLVLLGDEHRVAIRSMAFDEPRFRKAVEEIRPGSGLLNLDTAPRMLAGLARELAAARKEVYLVTDAQALDWRQVSPELRESFAELAAAGDVFLATVPGVADNLAVTNLELISGSLHEGTIARYQATVCNEGPGPVADVTVRCRVDDVQVDAKAIPVIEPGASETVALFAPFHNAGPRRITAEIEEDPLAIDNVRRAVVMVQDRVNVLCVDGSSGAASRLIGAALLARGDGTESENYVVRSVPWLAFPAENLEDVDVIVMADVPEITPDQADQLGRFVRRGNGLVWFAGAAVKPAAWNERAANAAQPLLPARLGGVVRVGDAIGAGQPLDPAMPDHPVCLPLLSLPEDLFSETRFLELFEVEPRPSSFAVLRLAAGGQPILLEHPLGRGEVFMFTTSAEPSWNNLALTPVFPLLLQQIVIYLAGREFEPPRQVGDSLSLAYVEQPDASDAVFETPSGDSISVPVIDHGGQYVALLERAREPGFYAARVSVQAPSVPIAVNVDSRESDVACLTDAELRAGLDGLNTTIVSSAGDLTAAIDASRTGRSGWRLFMGAALACLILESLFADLLLRRQGSRHSLPAASPA